ncbi:HAMP domain-containing protein, partial [Acidovorax sp. FJL06]|uniref:MCP four helix bundle domain-containing protein n=1 Tax=Acidovorax sp. FJL06 TaxID=2153365 RepID=UPI001F1CF1D0
MANGVNVQAIQFRNIALISDERVVKPSLERVAEMRRAIAEQMKTLNALVVSEKGKEILARVQQHREAFLKLGDEYVALIQQGKRDEALKLLEVQLLPVQAAYQKAIQEQVDFQAQMTDDSGKRAEAAADALQRDVLIAGALAVVVAIFLAISIIRSITRPLAQAVEAADRVAAGDLSGQIVVQSKDETGQLLGALQRMQQSLVNT